LRILKRQALTDNTIESWERYSRALERFVANDTTDLEYMYFVCLLPGNPSQDSQYHPYEEGYNPSWWGIFKEEMEALKFAIGHISGFIMEDDLVEWQQALAALKDGVENDGDVGEILTEWNENPALRQGDYLGGGQHVYPPIIYIIGLDI